VFYVRVLIYTRTIRELQAQKPISGDTGDIFNKLVGEGDDKINSILGGTANQNVDHIIIYRAYLLLQTASKFRTYAGKR
jgi:hypothetical protein